MMRVRIIQQPTYPDHYIVQYRNWWQILWRTYRESLDEKTALAVGKRLLNPLIVEILP